MSNSFESTFYTYLDTGAIHNGTELTRGSSELLSLLLVIATSISIVSVVLAFITFSLFSDLRTLSGTSLLNLLAGFFLVHLLSVIGVEQAGDQGLCLTLALLLQYLWLAVQCWLCVMSRDMYFTFRDNINLKPSIEAEKQKPFFTCALVAWISPGVVTCLAFALHGVAPVEPPVVDGCWIVSGNSMIYGIIVPGCFLVSVDIWYIAKSSWMVRRITALQVSAMVAKKMRRRRSMQLFLYLKLVLLFTSTWIIGLLSVITRQTILWYIFAGMSSLHGFFVSLAYSCNARVFRSHGRAYKINRKNYNACDLSRSASLALLTWTPSPNAV